MEKKRKTKEAPQNKENNLRKKVVDHKVKPFFGRSEASTLFLKKKHAYFCRTGGVVDHKVKLSQGEVDHKLQPSQKAFFKKPSF